MATEAFMRIVRKKMHHHLQDKKEIHTFAVPKLISGGQKAVDKDIFALRKVVVAETPTRLLIRPRTPKRGRFYFLNLISHE